MNLQKSLLPWQSSLPLVHQVCFGNIPVLWFTWGASSFITSHNMLKHPAGGDNVFQGHMKVYYTAIHAPYFRPFPRHFKQTI